MDGRLSDNRGDGTLRVPAFAMLSVPTLWTVFVVNFLALGLIWAYVTRSYPKFAAARFWTARRSSRAAGAPWRCCASVRRIRCCRCWPAAPR